MEQFFYRVAFDAPIVWNKLQWGGGGGGGGGGGIRTPPP